MFSANRSLPAHTPCCSATGISRRRRRRPAI